MRRKRGKKDKYESRSEVSWSEVLDMINRIEGKSNGGGEREEAE
jgi:hypothetical protein